ncbi:FAD-binding oxidoreductase [Haematobacter genomosp. 1]|uniref:FAD-linked oxidase n=1 Tax=Haematobacter genomosp. 1 TaxID=366618 RepID=A0A212A933_9RHOB|nr:FAD-binding oxidoreductase [Haematobacter genomosp. 1]OWJ76547.1 FAD-linked oxidase [Haematobacter genomosp. 1]
MNLDAFQSELHDIPQTTDTLTVKRKSRDMTTAFSPIMRDELKDRFADMVISPRTKDDVIRIARAAARHRVPLMPRGAGTCNWGQGIPLAGGAVLDMTGLNRLVRHEGHTVRVEPGMICHDIDRATQPKGQELRMHPSTRYSTIGGFVGGGHVGLGSCTWGILRDLGNIQRVEVISVEEEPRVVELKGADVNRVHHAYGSNGIITELEFPLAPAYGWTEAIVDFADFLRACDFGITLNRTDGIVPKMVAMNEWRYAKLFTQTGLGGILRDGRHTVHVMIATPFLEAFESLAADFGGTIVYSGPEGQGPFGKPLYEYSFGHARMNAIKVDPTFVANIGVFPHDRLMGSIAACHEKFHDLGPMRFDMKRMDGHLTAQGSPLFHYEGPEQMARVIEMMQEEGVAAANTHTMHVKENGMKPVDDAELAFKAEMDPWNLMNPGKITAAQSDVKGKGVALPTSGWSYRRA